MSEMKYVNLHEINADDLIPILNHQKNREHLIEHALFDAESIREWIHAKLKVDATQGCKVRAILANHQLAGWCGIQLEGETYEMAIVLDQKFWGLGRMVFYEMMRWAKELGHDTVLIHFLHTRPEYKFLRRMSKNVYESEIFGNRFLTYQLSVS